MYFPPLRSGLFAQYPVSRTDEYALAEAEAPGGTLWRSRTNRPPVRRWRLELEDLSDEEAAQLVSFYESCRGGWQTFSFPDPMANLFAWSEDLTASVWKRSPGVSVTRANAEAPAEFLVVNASGAPGRLWQDLDLAPGAAVCFSCELQGSPGKEAGILAGGAVRRILMRDAWQAESVTGFSSGGPQSAGIELAAGAALRVRCLQAEVQVAPSAYQPTFEAGGIFSRTRFAQDGLLVVSTAPGRNRVTVVLESAMESGL